VRVAALSSSNFRRPGLTVLSGGAALPNLIDADILTNAHFAAARFRLRFAVDPVDVESLFPPGAILDIQLGFSGSATSILQGEADTIRIDVLNRTVEVDGRDLTARLLDARTQETFSNQTASEIAQTLAGRHGLIPDITATTTLAGRYYSSEHDRITLGQFSRTTTEWDLLTFLAAREGFETFVSGQTLTFAPLPSASPTLTLTPDLCVGLSLEHTLTLARDIEVTVKSWNTKQQAAITQTARSSGQGRRTGGAPQHVMVIRPNLSPNDALQLAARILADLSAHERLVHAELPGELDLTPRTQVLLSGTGTDFDQLYYVAELDRHFSLDHGFTERIRLKNSPAGNTVA
jgi:phage protein D